MYILQKRVRVLYRFRCNACKSKFEMTEDEKLENDLEFNNYKDKLDRFNCPVCGHKGIVIGGYMHRFAVMDDKTEIKGY